MRGTVCLVAAILAACAAPAALDLGKARAAVLRPIALSEVKDARAAFRALFCALTLARAGRFPDERPCEKALVRLPDESVVASTPSAPSAARLPLTLVFVTGLFGDCFGRSVAPFADSYAHLESLGYRTKLILVSGRSSPESNAREINRFLTGSLDVADRDVVLVGYSKGAVDLLEALDRNPDAPWMPRIRALVSVAGAINGSPLADRFAPFYDSLLARLPWPSCPRGDGLGLDSLERHQRLDALARMRLPKDILYYSLVAMPVTGNVNTLLIPFYEALAKTDPANDGQLLAYDAIVPGSTLLGFVNADHWSVALPFDRVGGVLGAALSSNNAFPREILAESIARFVEGDLLAPKAAH